MIHGEEVAWRRARRGGVTGEEEKDEGVQVAEGVRERSLYGAVGALACILGC